MYHLSIDFSLGRQFPNTHLACGETKKDAIVLSQIPLDNLSYCQVLSGVPPPPPETP